MEALFPQYGAILLSSGHWNVQGWHGMWTVQPKVSEEEKARQKILDDQDPFDLTQSYPPVGGGSDE